MRVYTTPINIAKMTKRVTFQHFIEQRDIAAGFQDEWQDKCTVYAYIKPYSADDLIRAQATEVTVTHRIIIRYRAEIDNETRLMRIMYNGRKLDVKTVTNINEENRFLDIICEEDKSHG